MHPLTSAFQASLATTDLPQEPVSMAFISDMQIRVEDAFRATELDLKAASHHYAAQLGISKSASSHIGLNTVGMLTDRLSILVIKSYFEKSLDLIETTKLQIQDIETAIAASCPGTSSAFNKITTISASDLPVDFTEAAMSLAGTNLLLWMAQDVLYLRGPSALPDQELRKYITFFAEKNVIRNHLISLTNSLFWDV